MDKKKILTREEALKNAENYEKNQPPMTEEQKRQFEENHKNQMKEVSDSIKKSLQPLINAINSKVELENSIRKKHNELIQPFQNAINYYEKHLNPIKEIRENIINQNKMFFDYVESVQNSLRVNQLIQTPNLNQVNLPKIYFEKPESINMELLNGIFREQVDFIENNNLSSLANQDQNNDKLIEGYISENRIFSPEILDENLTKDVFEKSLKTLNEKRKFISKENIKIALDITILIVGIIGAVVTIISL